MGTLMSADKSGIYAKSTPNKGCAIALMNTARSVLTFPIMQKGTFDECFRLPARSQTQNKSEEL